MLNANLLIFKTVVAGDSWGDVAVPLIEHHPWLATGIFVGSHLTIVFGVLNLPLGATGESFQVAIPGYVWGKMFIILTLGFPKLGR